MLMMPERETLPSLEQLNYEVLEWIPTKSDGMARLVKARSESGDTVTLKIARVDSQDAVTEKHNLAIISESACLQALASSPGVVPILPIQGSAEDNVYHYQTLDEDGAPAYLVQPFLAGATLSRFIGTELADPLVALQIVHSLARTLASIHDAGWVHRDLKPNNIMFADAPTRLAQADGPNQNSDSAEEPILIDFGIAARTESEIVAEGTISWMAPEVRVAFDNSRVLKASPLCDIYGVGLLLCYMLSGTRPTINLSSQENRAALRSSAFSAINTIDSDAKSKAELNELIDSLLDENPEKRPTAHLIGSKISRIMAKMRHPYSLPKRFAMYKKRYASSIWRITGSIAVAFLTILLGRQLFQATDTTSGATDTMAVVELQASATPTFAPPQGFPSAQGAATATLLPSSIKIDALAGMQASGSSSSAVDSDEQPSQPQGSNGGVASGDAAEGRTVANADQMAAAAGPERSGLGWLPSFSFSGTLLNRFAWLSTPEAPAAANVNESPAVPTPVVAATATLAPTPTASITPTTNPYIFPEVAAIVKITGKAHPCFQSWQMTDTWNKHASDTQIPLIWERINRIPFDAEAKFQIGIALEPRQLLPYQAIPISQVVKENQIAVDPLNALWVINGLVERQEVVNRPYVWGVFLVGASGRMVTRVSPVCYFQLDGEMMGRLPSE